MITEGGFQARSLCAGLGLPGTPGKPFGNRGSHIERWDYLCYSFLTMVTQIKSTLNDILQSLSALDLVLLRTTPKTALIFQRCLVPLLVLKWKSNSFLTCLPYSPLEPQSGFERQLICSATESALLSKT